jgi:hypothetical protein
MTVVVVVTATVIDETVGAVTGNSADSGGSSDW